MDFDCQALASLVGCARRCSFLDKESLNDEVVGKRKKPEAIEQAKAVFKLCDKDGDGKLCAEELKKKPPEARFKQMDKDGDRVVTCEEMTGKRKKPEDIERIEKNFKRLDKDGDGKVTLEELKAAQKGQEKGAGKKKAKGTA